MKHSLKILFLAFLASELKAAETGGKSVQDDEPHVKPRFSSHTEARIVNNTPLDIIDTHVSNIDSWDWEDGKGPDQTSKLLHRYIGAHGDLQVRLEVEYFSTKSPYTLALDFKDGSSVSYRINQQAAIGACAADLNYNSQIYDIGYSRDGKDTLVVTIGYNQWTTRINELLQTAKTLLQENKFEDAENEIENTSVLARLADWGIVSTALKGDFANTNFAVLKKYGTVLYEGGLQSIYTDNVQATRNLTDARLRFQKALNIKSDQEIKDYTGVIDGLLNK